MKCPAFLSYIVAIIVIALSLGVVWWKNKTGESGYGFSTTGEKIAEGIDLSGKVAIVTGANTGLGFETARVLAWGGAKVFVLARSQEKADKAVSELTEVLDEKLEKKRKKEAKEASDKTKSEEVTKKDETTGWKLVPMVLELDSLKSIDDFVKEFLSLEIPLHYLINNAASAVKSERAVTQDEFEMNIGVDHLGHFHLTNLLLEKLKQSSPSRIVIVSSEAAKWGDDSFLDDPNFDAEPYTWWNSYSNAKRANIYHASALANRLANTKVTAYSLHPGTIHTGMGRHLNIFFQIGLAIIEPFICKNIKQGAATQIYAALEASESDSGKYFIDSNKASMEFATSATDMHKMNAFWDKSQKLITEARAKNLDH